MTHEILPCKLCKSEATLSERYRYWECSNPSCLCTGPGEDEAGEKWNELMRVESAVRYQVEENGELEPVPTTQSILGRLGNVEKALAILILGRAGDATQPKNEGP